MTLLKALIISPALPGIIFLVVSLLQEKFPPKKINNVYGYRTKKSMSSEENWKIANSYSSKLVLNFSFILITLGGLSIFLLHNSLILSIVTVVSSAIAAILVIVLTEKKLK
ncbi:SdpI/YhfL protein family protein [Chitinophaga terrae (ex Kim and Jung 2007)]|uniref:SdpI/YhfL protein family protein n=1 Tax=Chitinophaga terrae (ex Kim and Jung 2007) TaxID=408074 RepID=A0A1H4GBB2_9BACT|nr:SdpI/YhfL protein family protein [Chitinophaga terrae (ex Kim and Jung 2007)]